MSLRGPAMNASDDGDLASAAYQTRCTGCGLDTYGNLTIRIAA